MAINIEGAIRGDDPRIPKVESLNGATILGFLNGKVVSIDAVLIGSIVVPATLTAEQKEIALQNIGATTSEEVDDQTDYKEVMP